MGRGDYSRADRDRYQQYIGSAKWARRKRRALALAGWRCQYEHDDPFHGAVRCPRRRYLAVHHRTYERLGHEADADLEVLCWFHHMVEHLMWQVCDRCREPVLGGYADAEDWLRAVLAAERCQLDVGAVNWAALPAQFALEALVPPLCPTCTPWAADGP